MLKLASKRGHDVMCTDSPTPSVTSCTPFDFTSSLQQQQQQQQQQQPNVNRIFPSLQPQQPISFSSNSNQQQQVIQDSRIKRVRHSHGGSQSTFMREDYDYFNNTESPIPSIVSSIDKKYKSNSNNQNNNNKASEEQQKQNIFNFNSNNNQSISPVKKTTTNNNTTTTATTNLFNLSSPPKTVEKTFSLDEVKELIKKALEEHEIKLRAQYDKILYEKLNEQFQCFSKYNDEYISRQMRDSEFSYMS